MDIQVIENTITDLENAENTFENCSKLASLYIIRDECKNANTGGIDTTESELLDILPAYRYYVDAKRKYQMNTTDDEAMVATLSSLCVEIYEFFQTLFSGTDIPKERNLIRELIEKLQKIA